VRAGRRAIAVSAAAVLAAAAVLFLPAADCLVVRTRSGRTAELFPLGREEPAFVISWLHSVSKEPCAEYFRKGKGGTIELYRTVFRGLGAGLPFSDEGGTVSLQDGSIVIDGLSRSFPRIVLAALPLTQHRLQVGGRELDVLELIGGERFAVFSIERKSLGSILRGRAGAR
jgi:hypothetical protein